MNHTTKTDQETKDLGKQLAKKLQGGEIVCLYGELGAGKTTLVKGIAEGLGSAEEITSPTFTLMNIYSIPSQNSEVKSLVHIDTYRLKDEQELLEIGAEDYLGKADTICLIEWPEKIEGLLKDKKIKKIFLAHGQNQEHLIRIED